MKGIIKEKRPYMILGVTIILTLVPLYNILIRQGEFDSVDRIKELSKPEFYQGGLVLIAFGLIGYTLLSNEKYQKLFKYLVMLYLALEGVIIPVLTVYVFFEILRYFGFTFLISKASYINKRPTTDFVVGLTIWGVLSIVMSLAEIGTIGWLRVGLILLLTLSIVLNVIRGVSGFSFMFTDLTTYVKQDSKDRKQLILKVFMVFFVLMLFGKTNTAIDFDSIWYGLRPEQVLVGPHSFYDYMGYSAFVYYYPKLWELIFLPISGLRDYSFLISANIFIYSLFVYEFYNLALYLLKKSDEYYAYALSVSVFTIPALGNIAVSAKPDILGAFFLFSSFSYFIRSMISKNKLDISLFLSCLILMTGTKLTYLLWGGLFFIQVILYLIYKFRAKISFHTIKSLFIEKLDYGIIIPTTILILGIHYRTWRLTGYPFYPIALEFFQIIGFKAIYPAKILGLKIKLVKITTYNLISNLLRFIIVNSKASVKISALWLSNLYIVLGIAVLSSCKKIKKHWTNEVFTVMAIFQFMFMINYMMAMGNTDGNYYIFPIGILCFMLGVVLIRSFDAYSQKDYKKIISLGITLIITTNAILTFSTHPSGKIGTSAFDMNVFKDNFDSVSKAKAIVKENGYSKITAFIENDFKGRRIISSARNPAIINIIGGQIEMFSELESEGLSNSEITESYEGFVKYIERGNIQGILLLYDFSKTSGYVRRLIKEKGYKQKIVDDKATFYELS